MKCGNGVSGMLGNVYEYEGQVEPMVDDRTKKMVEVGNEIMSETLAEGTTDDIHLMQNKLRNGKICIALRIRKTGEIFNRKKNW